MNDRSGDEEESDERDEDDENEFQSSHPISLSKSIVGSTSGSVSIDCEEQTLPIGELNNDQNDEEITVSEMDRKSSTINHDFRPANDWDKFRLLMWKNFLLQWRHKVQAILEILVPVLFSAMLLMIRSFVSPTIHSDITLFEPFEINSLSALK